MIELSAPSQALTDRLTSEVSFDERVVASKMMGTSGNSSISLYSFAEVVEFLEVPDDGGQLLVKGGRQYIPYIRPSTLRDWVGGVMADAELAAAIAQHLDDGQSFVEQLRVIGQLMHQRWEQVATARQEKEPASTSS